jgi:micrococcal nuclease
MTRGHRPYWRGYRTQWYWVAITILLVVQWYLLTPPGANGPESLAEGIHQVRRVVDGIDTPETVKEDHPVEPWGPEASRFTKDFVAKAGGRVRLTFGLERRDDYGRFLAFVWNGDVLLNEELVRAGLARARLGYRYTSTMKRRLARAQEEAQHAKRGMWSDTTPAPSSGTP